MRHDASPPVLPSPVHMPVFVAPTPGARAVQIGLALLLVAGCSGDMTDQIRTPPEPSPADAAPAAPTLRPPQADEHAETGDRRPQIGRFVAALTNRARTTRRRAALQTDPVLRRIACHHNQDMLAHQYLGHEDAEGRLPSDRLAREHRRLVGSVGENVYGAAAPPRRAEASRAKTWAQRALDGWMNSSGHRENVLRPQFTHLGTCVTQGHAQAKATQVFATVWAYAQEPLPWTHGTGDSLSVAMKPVEASGPPVAYAFASVDAPLGKALETRRRSFDGTLRLPKTPGVYEGRFAFPQDRGRRVVVPGPRVRVVPSPR